MLCIHDNLYAAILQEHVLWREALGYIHDICESGAPGSFDAKAQTDAFATLCYVCRDLPGG
jgi:hypothetical protein